MSTKTDTRKARTMTISTESDMDVARRTGRPCTFTEWQWAVVAEVDGRVSGTVAYNRHTTGSRDGSGWHTFANWHFDSVEEFNAHVDAFAVTAVANGSKVHVENWN